MKYRRYGKTEIKIPIFSFGAMRTCFNDSKVTGAERNKAEENALATMRRALDLGMNHFDTARGYDNSQRLVGMAVREFGRESFSISTKLCSTTSYSDTAARIDEALELMQTDHIDIMDVHGINTPEKLAKTLAPDGCLKAMQDARSEGKIRHIAFSSHAGPELIIETMETGLFEAVSLHYYYTYQRHAATVARARELDIGVLILSPSEKGGLLFKPTAGLSEVCDPFTPLVLNHRWMISNPGVSTISIGAGNPEELDAHMQAIEGPDKLTEEEQAAIERWSIAEKEMLGDTRCTLCYKCMPCPQGVTIPEILRLRNLACAFDMTEFGKMRYNLLGNGDDWFPGEKSDKCTSCGECLPKCPEDLDIPALLAETEVILKDEQVKRLWKDG